MKSKLRTIHNLFKGYMSRNSELMMSVGGLFYLSFLVVGFEQGFFLQNEFPLCSTSLQPLVQDFLFAAIYVVGSLQLLFLVIEEYIDVAGILGSDNADNLKEYARKYVVAVFALVAIEAFLTLFINYDIGCMTPGFPPSPSEGGFLFL